MDSLDFYGLLAPPSTIPAPPILDPAQPAAPAAPPTQPRWRTRYGVAYCTICDMAADYCKGHLPPAQSPDGAESQLLLRIAEARAKAGGR